VASESLRGGAAALAPRRRSSDNARPAEQTHNRTPGRAPWRGWRSSANVRRGGQSLTPTAPPRGARSMMNSGPVRDGAAQAASAASDAPLLKLEDFLPHRLNVLSSLVSQALTRVYGRYGI